MTTKQTTGEINMGTNDQIEQQIQDLQLTAPRITPADIEVAIAFETYFTAEQGAQHKDSVNVGRMPMSGNSLPLLTICVLVLRNGFTVTGESACASRENFNAEIGRKISRKHAMDKLWPLLGYQLRSILAGKEERNKLVVE